MSDAKAMRVRDVLRTISLPWREERGGAERACRELLESAGVTVGGPEPYDIHVANPAFYRRVLAEGLLGLGESYMDGWWEAGSSRIAALSDRWETQS